MRIMLLGLCACFVACGGDASTSLDEDLGDPKAIQIGFNMGHMDQFDYLDDFYSKDKKAPRLCHTYTSWNVGSSPQVAGDPNAPQPSRAWLTDWLSKANGQCDEVLISFKAHATKAESPPNAGQFETAFHDFVTSGWPYKGKYVFTVWNEPNNQFDAGNGLGTVIPADLAAEYYLTAEEVCKGHGCKVVAGDFASNGSWWHDFEWNCADDTVAPKDLCNAFSSENPKHHGPSYLDRYKNYIANFADGKESPLKRKHHLASGFRPAYFAFHGWHDINAYLDDGAHCTSYDNCLTRILLKSMGGSWHATELWDTEAGIDQDKTPISDKDQACGAAFLLRVTAWSSRITRLYITRLHGGAGELYTTCNPNDAGCQTDGHRARIAANVLAIHESQAPKTVCK